MAVIKNPGIDMRVFVFGGASQSRLCHHILSSSGHTFPFIFDETRSEAPSWFPGRLITKRRDILTAASECDAFIVAVGNAQGADRSMISERLVGLGLSPVSVISKAAHLGETTVLGRGLQAMSSAVVSEFGKVGDWCILNTNCTVDHEAKIGNGVHIMGGASIAGRVTIEDFATIGTNATILPDVRIGRYSYIGAGAVVLRDVPPSRVFAGVPAKEIKSSAIPRSPAFINF